MGLRINLPFHNCENNFWHRQNDWSKSDLVAQCHIPKYHNLTDVETKLADANLSDV